MEPFVQRILRTKKETMFGRKSNTIMNISIPLNGSNKILDIFYK